MARLRPSTQVDGDFLEGVIDESEKLSRLAAHSFKTQVLRPPHPDFEIKVEDYTWQVHIGVFAAKFEFFRALQENHFKEGQERSVTLFEDRAALIARLMLWAYHGNYQVYRNEEVEGLTVNDLLESGLRQSPQTATEAPRTPSNTQPEDIVMSDDHTTMGGLRPRKQENAKRANLAKPSMADLKATKTPAVRHKTEVREHWNMYTLADKYGCPELRQHCMKSMFQVASRCRNSIWYILDYINNTSIPVEDIRQEVISFFKTYCKEYLGEPRFEELVRTTPGLAWALVSQYGRR